MDRREIARQLARYLLWTVLISSGATVCMIQVLYSGMSSSLESNQGRLLMSVIAVMWLQPLAYCSVTMFLNLSTRIRQSWVYSASSFFLLPLICTPVCYFNPENTPVDLFPFLLTTTIYFLVLGYFFLKFFRQHNQKNIE